MRFFVLLVTVCAACAASKEPVRPSTPRPTDAAAEVIPEAAQPEPALSPEATFHFVRASMLLEKGDARGAAEAVREAMVFDHRSAVLHALLSTALLRQGDNAGALQEAERAVALNEHSVEGHAARAAAFWEAGRFQDAEAPLRTVVKQAPERPVEAARLMELLVRRGDVEGARKISRLHVEKAGASDESLVLLAEVCRKQAAWDCASSALDEAVRAAPASADICRMRAGVLEARGKFAAAADAWTICLALEPGHEGAEHSLITSLARSGHSDELRARFTRLTSADLPRVLAAGEALLDAHDVEDTRWLATRAQEQWPALTELKGLEGRAYALMGECEKAETLLRDVPPVSVVGVQAAEARAGCLLRLHKTTEAIDVLQKSAGLRAEATELHALLCRAYKDADRPKDAAQVAISLGETGHLMTRARCLIASGDAQAGIALVEKRLVDTPDNPELLFAKALVQWDAERKTDAVKTARLLLASHPDDERALNFLAYALLRTGGNASEALRLAQRAFDKQPASAEVLDTLGEALVTTGNVQRGLETLQDAARRLSHDPEVLMHLGDAYQAAGKMQQARETWQRARALLPLEPSVDTALRTRLGLP